MTRLGNLLLSDSWTTNTEIPGAQFYTLLLTIK